MLVGLALAVVVGVALYRNMNRRTQVNTDANGTSNFDTQNIPKLGVTATCDRNGGPPELSFTKPSNTINVQVKEISHTDQACTVPDGKQCKQQTWVMEIDHTFYQDLDPQRKPKQQNETYSIPCPCWCPADPQPRVARH